MNSVVARERQSGRQTLWNSPRWIGLIALLTAIELGMLVWTLLPAHFHGWRYPCLLILLCGSQLLNLSRFSLERRRRLLTERS